MRAMRLLLAVLVWIALPAQAQDIPEWFSQSFLDLREDVAQAAKDGKRLLVYFSQEGCPACKLLTTVTFRDPNIVAKTRRNFSAIAINTWGAREVTWTDGRTMSEKQLAALLKVHATPTLIFLDEKGGVALRFSGYLPPAQFEPKLDLAARKAAG